jgi:hypothetical protein
MMQLRVETRGRWRCRAEAVSSVGGVSTACGGLSVAACRQGMPPRHRVVFLPATAWGFPPS